MTVQASAAPREAEAQNLTARIALIALYICLIVGAIAAAWSGLRLRKALYLWSDPIRFTGDISNAWYWGSAAASEGVVTLYDRLDREVRQRERRAYDLDYPPVRTWLVSRWAMWAQARFPDAHGWQRDYAFSAPMLWGNNIAEMLSALAVFLIVRRQVLRGRADPVALPGRGVRAKAVIIGFIGAMLLWFNPGVLFDAHCFPQWDMWIMPMFLFAVLAGMYGRFFAAGLLLGTGALIKGQILWGAPVLLLWPLCAGNWRGAMSILLGVVASTAAFTWPWLVRGRTAHLVVIGVGMAGLLLVASLRKWRWLYLPVGVMGLAALACGLWLGGSFSWFNVGFTYGASKFPVMYTIGTSTLCTILQERFAIPSPHILIGLPWVGDVQLRVILTTMFAVSLLICGCGAAVHFRRRDPRFLVAIAAPFVLFYTLMPQMHDRYLVWGVAATALMAGVGVGMTVLHLGLTFIMWAAVARNLYSQGPWFSPRTLEFLNALHCDIAWALLVLSAVMLYQAWPTWKKRPTGRHLRLA